MLEYKRQVATLENRLEKALRRAADHDDHLRIIDGWWLQVGCVSGPWCCLCNR